MADERPSSDRALPDAGDVAAWDQAIAEQRLGDFAPGAVAAALRALPVDDGQTRRELTLHLSDVVIGILHKKVRGSHPDGGREIVEGIHGKVLAALLDPGSADGAALVTHFHERLHFRFLDAVKRSRRRQQVELPPLVDDDVATEEHADPVASTGYASVEVGQTLSLIRDQRKRLAFTMSLAGRRKGEIARELGIDRKTLFVWLREVREFLQSAIDL